MDVKTLKIDSTFLTFFRNRAVGVSKQTAEWRLQKVLKGNFQNISFYLTFLDDFSKNCSWTSFEEVFIPYYEEIFKKNDNIHRFINNGELKFEQWKQIITDNYLTPTFPKIYDDLGLGEHFDFQINFRVSDTEGILSENTLLFDHYGSTQTLTVAYNEDTDQTYIDFGFEVRGEMFNEIPWGSDYPNFFVQKQNVEYNRKLLTETLLNFQKNLNFDIVDFNFEWGSHRFWTIDKSGFIN
ncbi:hypothetical protein [Runella zeae]|uniref:hypothetical protein n=1 Tax=Runella zeae TaxID=94255 RepID=UPI0004035C95|nr:hypothetical protein [Runella zeae]